MSSSVVRSLLNCGLSAVLALSCGSSSSGGSSGAPTTSDEGGAPSSAQPNSRQLFSKTIQHIVFETVYVPGAEPYVGQQGDFGDIWSLFETNVKAVFEGRKDVKLPTTLAGMGKLALQASDMSDQDLVDLAGSVRKQTTDPATGTQSFFLVFVNGHHKLADGTVDNDTVGVSVGDTGIIGIFKPTYTAYYNPKKDPVAQIMEQIAVIHFFGHAIGWVNNGVPIADGNQPHQDTAHGSHCTNTQCAMNYAFETSKGIGDFIGKLPVSSTSVLYDQECLSDVRLLENSEL